MKRIKYIAYYDRVESVVNRNYVLSAVNKIDYIISRLNKNDISVDVVSFSGCLYDYFYFDRGGVVKVGQNTIRHFSSFSPSNIGVFRLLSRYWQSIQFFFWFLLNVDKNEKVIVYHSLGYCKLLTLLKKLKGCIYIGEIEEIYQDVSPIKRSMSKAEFEFIDVCDSYLFPTHFLNEKLNQSNKPNILIHGVYEVEKLRNVKWNDSDIHVVYAGTFDPNKGGAVAAISAAAYLPYNYHIHICGFGTNHDIEGIKMRINEISLKSQAKVTFDGLIKGEEFICFLQKCQIGLSTQNPLADFNDTSFPSKILTYLSNGLKVVSIRIPVVELSGIGNCVSYYEEQNPEMIANAILGCDLNTGVESSLALERLDSDFIEKLYSLVS